MTTEDMDRIKCRYYVIKILGLPAQLSARAYGAPAPRYSIPVSHRHAVRKFGIKRVRCERQIAQLCADMERNSKFSSVR